MYKAQNDKPETYTRTKTHNRQVKTTHSAFWSAIKKEQKKRANNDQ